MSALEDSLAQQIRYCRLPKPEREYRFAPPRRFRFDFAWPDRLLACEVQGAVWTSGRHTRGAGATTDAEKLSLAAVAGWRVILATAEHVKNGQALNWIEQALQKHER